MGQIVSSAAKPKRCNANQLSQMPTPAAGEYILVSSDNSMNAVGQGNFDCYIKGNGSTAATTLELKSIADSEITMGGLNAINSKALYIDLESEIILSNYTTDRRFIGADGKWKVNLQSYAGKVIPVTAGTKYKITASAEETTVCFLKSLNNYNTSNGAVDYATGYSGNGVAISANTSAVLPAPNNATYIYITTYTTKDVTPQYFGTLETIERYVKTSELSNSVTLGTRSPATSDAIYKFGSIGLFSLIDLSSIEEVYAFPNASGKWSVNYSNYKGKFIECASGDVFKVTASQQPTCVVALRSNSHAANTNVDYATGFSGNGITINAQETIEVTIPEDGRYFYVQTKSNGVDVEPSAVKKLQLTPIKDILEDTDAIPVENSSLLVESGGVFAAINEAIGEVIDEEYTFVLEDDFSGASVGTLYPNNISINNQSGVFTISSTTAGGRAMIYFPPSAELVIGKEYTLSFDYTCSANKTCWWFFSSSPQVAGDNDKAFSTEGTAGHKVVTFTYDTDTAGIYVVGANFVGETIVASNFVITENNSIRERLKECTAIAEDAKGTADAAQYDISDIRGQLSLIGASYDGNVSWKSYTGNSIIPKNRFGIKELTTMYGQGMAIYNNIAFFFVANGNTFSWFNILTEESGTDCPLGFGGSDYHCNSASFSNIFYDENDVFPLLYIAGMEGTRIHEMKVVRITPNNNSYSGTLVQTITIPAYANVAMEGNYMYLNGDSGLFKYNIPPIFDANENPITTYTLTNSDIVSSWTIYVPNTLQGCCVHNGVLYQLSNEGIMLVFDTITNTEINRVTMSSVGINYEQEDLDFSGDTMFLSCAGHFYRVWLD